ncbi:MAG: hypothetical protein NZ960_00430 [Candidatus Kapabacteria bacterium]|nr:hypothetical protein [Candidatus Kapabacteria bacterium]MDW8011493.1 hypothetical protein [Bacteroidota bacterium]
MRIPAWAISVGVVIGAAGCLTWRIPERAPRIVIFELTPEPGIPLNPDPVRSAQGDVLLFLPKGWFPLELGDKAPRGIVAVGVNPEYTLAVTVAKLYPRAPSDTARQYDLLELARQSFVRRQMKTAVGIRLIGDFAIVRVGQKAFATYRFAGVGRHVRVAVFVSLLGVAYEVALVPLLLRVIEPPPEEEQEQLFESILRALQF